LGRNISTDKKIQNANVTASATKSITSALAGIALREHFLSSLDQKMKEFFPEVDWTTLDPRKSEITIRQML
jgi:CubicO group peptidase (beta-lactamase class C family)